MLSIVETADIIASKVRFELTAITLPGGSFRRKDGMAEHLLSAITAHRSKLKVVGLLIENRPNVFRLDG